MNQTDKAVQGCTPGPWTVADEQNENLFGGAISTSVLDECGFPIADVDARPVLHNWDEKYPEMTHWADGAADGRTQVQRTAGEVAANARLIAAAPDLLGALEEVYKWLIKDWDGTDESLLNDDFRKAARRARAAIARAKGRGLL